MVWLSLLGTAYACGRLEHMAYDMLAEKLQGQALLTHMRAVAALVLAFSATVFLYAGLKLVLRAFQVAVLRHAGGTDGLLLPHSCIPSRGHASFLRDCDLESRQLQASMRCMKRLNM